jgi:hypothetical protein
MKSFSSVFRSKTLQHLADPGPPAVAGLSARIDSVEIGVMDTKAGEHALRPAADPGDPRRR